MVLKSSKIVILLLIFLYLSNFSNADFGTYSEKPSINVCRCSQADDIIKIKNTGEQLTKYTLISNLDFVTLTPSEFQLEAGDIKNVKIEINAPCKNSKKNLIINIQSDKEDNDDIVKQLTIGQCQNLQTRLYTKTNEVNPCTQVNYELLIKNTGSFNENYSIISNHDSINLSENKIGLNPNQEKIVNALTGFSCGVYGETPIVFKVLAENNALQTTLKHNLNIRATYNYSIKLKEDNALCEEEIEPISFILENDVKTPNTYYLELVNQPSFIELSQETITLESKEEKDINITLDVEEGRNIGYYQFFIKSRTKDGDISKKNNVSLNISDCYKPIINILDSQQKICAEEKWLNVNVKNKGLDEERISLKTNNEFVSFEKDYIILNSEEEKNMTLIFKPEDKNFDYEIIIRGVLDNNISSEDSVNMNVLSQWSCSEVITDKTEYSVRRDTENNAEIKISNIGLEDGNYKLSIKPEFWIKLNQTEIELYSGETKSIMLILEYTNETEFGEYPLTLTLIQDDLVYEKQLVVLLKDKPVHIRLGIYFSDKPCQLITVILAIAIIVLLVSSLAFRKKGRLKEKQFKKLNRLIILATIIVTILLYHYQGVPLLNDSIDYSKANQTHFIWIQDNNYEIPISSIVEDPDADQLELSLLDQEFVNLSVENQKIVLTPKQGWFGNTSIIIVAVDSKGASTDSPKIYLEVIKKNSKTIFETYVKFCWYVNWFFLLIILFLIKIIAFKKMRFKRS